MIPTGLALAHGTAGNARDGAEALVALHMIRVDIVQRGRCRRCGRDQQLAMMQLLVQRGQSLALGQLADAGLTLQQMLLLLLLLQLLQLLLLLQLLQLLALRLLVLHMILVHHVRVNHLGLHVVRIVAVEAVVQLLLLQLLLLLLFLFLFILIFEAHRAGHVHNAGHTSMATMKQSLCDMRVLPLATLIISAHRTGCEQLQRQRCRLHQLRQLRQLDETLQRVVEVPLVI